MAHYRVLIVDDNRDIRHLFAEALRSLSKDMDILEMPSAEEALFVTAGTHVDLLITDVYLPGISGLEMVKRLRKTNPTLRIILVTGASDPKVKDEVANAGAAAFFYKPVEIQELMQAVNKFREAGEGEAIPVEAVPVVAAPKPETVKSQSTIDLEGCLVDLQVQLKAQAAALLSDDGIVLAHTDDFNTFVGPDLAGRLSTVFKAGLTVSHSMKMENPNNLMGFAGPDYSICLVPVGNCFSLIVVGNQAFQASLLSPGRRMVTSAVELLRLLETPKPSIADTLPKAAVEETEVAEDQPVLPPPEEIPLVEAEPADVAALDAVFSQSADKSLQTEALDDFWENLAEQSETDGGVDQNILSYEEAQKRGLTPE